MNDSERTVVARVVDLRLADLWRDLFEIPKEQWDHELIGWFLRASYGQGYCDATEEAGRPGLCEDVRDALAEASVEAADLR